MARGYCSLEAEKAVCVGEIRRRSWWPRLARTTQHLIIILPRRGGRRAFAAFMADRLPDFQFDGRRGWWTAPLTEGNYRAAVGANSVKLNRDRSEVRLKLSPGIEAWLKNGGNGNG